ncbi:MAG: histidine-type phosphatase [Prevotellaceae bacterium]|nr:histidine-type phosphatase [Prevotellaceae bacterium]
MKKLIVLLVLVRFSMAITAQIVAEDFKKDIRRSATNQQAYPGPRQHTLTPAPKGLKPFYISHYGRHGSRYLINPKDYTFPIACLRSADSARVLTAVGRSVLERVEKMYAEAYMRFGELTPLGAVQHRQIAERMYDRFPEVFEGKTHVDAKSTVVIRCILSMANELEVLARKNPSLTFTQDASEHDMYYMNFNDKRLYEQRKNEKAVKNYDDYFKRHIDTRHITARLFSDTAYASRHYDMLRLYKLLYKLAGTMQNTEGRKVMSLYDIFTDDEIYSCFLADNAWWYANYGAFELNGGKQPYSQRRLLGRMIAEADSCIALPHPGATLRFGHETMVLPLTCLMGLDGYDYSTDDLESLESHEWLNYRIFPMAANIQMVFYRKSSEDTDVMVKVLLNENEARLPIKSPTAPYYLWKDVREYYLKKINNFEY